MFAKIPNFVTFRPISALLAHFGVFKYNMNDINHMYSVEHVFGIYLNIGISFHYQKKWFRGGQMFAKIPNFVTFRPFSVFLAHFWVSKYNMNDINHMYSVEHVFGI